MTLSPQNHSNIDLQHTFDAALGKSTGDCDLQLVPHCHTHKFSSLAMPPSVFRPLSFEYTSFLTFPRVVRVRGPLPNHLD